nr:hypothetical protein [Tanacetum cinerariifolium]
MVLFNIQIDNFDAQSNVRWMGVLHNALEILPRQSNKQFFPPSVQEELVNFIKKLGYVDPLTTVSQVVVNKLHQPYRKILSIFNNSLTGKASGIDRPKESIVQILTESDRDSNHGAESDNFDSKSVDSDKDNSDKNWVVDFMIRPHAKEPKSKQPEPQLHSPSVTVTSHDNSIKVNKMYGYAYLEEIVVRRTDQKEYMFAEADFPHLNQNDIEDLFLLKIQNKIHIINGVDEFDLINALHLYTRRIVIRKRVENVQVGVKSYQTKLNLTKP